MKAVKYALLAVILFSAIFASCDFLGLKDDSMDEEPPLPTYVQPPSPPTPPSGTYIVNFSNYNYSQSSDVLPLPQTVPIGSSIILPNGDGLIRSHYDFVGWSIYPHGYEPIYSAGDSFTPTGYTTLYAVWEFNPDQCTVTFDINGGEGVTPHPISATAYTYITLPGADTFAKTGYIFGGWKTIGGTTYNAGDNFSPTADNTLSAIWFDAYAVSFNANGGSGAVPSSITVRTGSSGTLPGGDGLSKTGYIFGGWNTDSSGAGTDYYPGASYTPTGNITLYARWDILLTENVWTDGSIDSSAAGASVWYSFNVTSGTTYYVWWNDREPIRATKSLDVAVSAVYHNGTSIFPNTNTGYTTPRQFTANTSGTVHIKMIPSKSGEVGTFAIVYSTGGSTRPAAYTVVFDYIYGEGGYPPSQTVSVGSSIILPDGDGLFRDGYIFGGWEKDPFFGNGTKYNVGDSFTPTADVILYVIWLPAPSAPGITLDVEQIIDGAPLFGDIIISRTNSGGYPVTYTVQVLNTYDPVLNAYSYSSIYWEVAGVGIYAGQIVTGSGNSFTLNAGEIKYNSLGGHVLTLLVSKNGQLYQRAIPFTIVP